MLTQTVGRVFVAVMKTSAGREYYSCISNGEGQRLELYKFNDLKRALYTCHDIGNFFGVKPDVLTESSYLSQEEIDTAYHYVKEFL